MALTKRQKQIAGVTTVGLVAIGLLVAGVASAAEPPIPGEDEEDEGDDYSGPGPNLPEGKVPEDRKDATPSATRPESIAPSDLWVSPDCDDVMEGSRWMEETVRPAIESWVSSGYGRPREFFNEALSQHRVVREILGPYAPLCVEVMFWADTYERENPFPADGTFEEQQAYNAQMNAAIQQTLENYPQLAELAGKVESAVMNRAAEEWPGESFPQPGQEIA